MDTFYSTYAVNYLSIHGVQIPFITILGSTDHSTISEAAVTVLGLTELIESPSSYEILLNPDIVGTLKIALKIDSHLFNVEFDVAAGIPGLSIASLGPEMAAASELCLCPATLTFSVRGGADLPMTGHHPSSAGTPLGHSPALQQPPARGD